MKIAFVGNGLSRNWTPTQKIAIEAFYNAGERLINDYGIKKINVRGVDIERLSNFSSCLTIPMNNFVYNIEKGKIIGLRSTAEPDQMQHDICGTALDAAKEVISNYSDIRFDAPEIVYLPAETMAQNPRVQDLCFINKIALPSESISNPDALAQIVEKTMLCHSFGFPGPLDTGVAKMLSLQGLKIAQVLSPALFKTIEASQTVSDIRNNDNYLAVSLLATLYNDFEMISDAFFSGRDVDQKFTHIPKLWKRLKDFSFEYDLKQKPADEFYLGKLLDFFEI